MDAVIFDLDQTLLDRDRSLREFIHWQCRGMLRPYLENEQSFTNRFIELDANGTVWKDRVYQELINEFSLADWSVQELLTVYETCFCAFALPREGVVEAVKSLAGKYKIGLISNGMTPFQERNFRALGISSVFESIIVSQAVGLRKPDRQIFHLGCHQLGASPQNTIFIGDNPIADMRGASDAGLNTIFVTTPLHADCAIADVICSDMRELPCLVEAMESIGAAQDSG